jgi:hypothetical protein
MDQSAIYPETICEGVVGACPRSTCRGEGSSTERLKTGARTSWEQHALGAPSPARIATRSVTGAVFALPICHT